MSDREIEEIRPDGIAPPFARYAHGVAIPEGYRLILTSGQLGLASDGAIPECAEGQADVVFHNLSAILAAEGAGPENVLRINAFVTDRMHMAGYMASRDRWLADVERLPASTLVIVSGFTRPEFLVEVEVIAAVRV